MLRIWRRWAARVRKLRDVPKPPQVRLVPPAGAAVPYPPAPAGGLPVTGFVVEPLGGGAAVAAFDRADLAGAVAGWLARGRTRFTLVALAAADGRYARFGFGQRCRWDFGGWSPWTPYRAGA